jgi:hypothetical protein
MTRPDGAAQLREGVLDLIASLEGRFSEMEEEELEDIRLLGKPFWPLINGPFSDILTHIGQVATLRRIAGAPAPDSNPFEGTPPPGR